MDKTHMGRTRAKVTWLPLLRRYVALTVMTNLLWEVVQLPLYTIWQEGTGREIVVAVLHCTAGDGILAMISLVIALTVAGSRAWPKDRFVTVAVIATLIGVGYTVFSEWLNIVVRKSWAYSARMPIVPGIGTGLFPLLQWLVLPPVCLMLARRWDYQALSKGVRQ